MKRIYAHRRISSRILSKMMDNHASMSTSRYNIDPAKFAMCHPVLDTGKPTDYYQILTGISHSGKTGTTWADALASAGKHYHTKACMKSCVIRYAFLRYGLIKEVKCVGRTKYWAITRLGASYLKEADKLLALH